MRESAVVQGLRSLVSKLHSQTPLDKKESQRLLNAVTESFRQQLDRAHPPRAAEDGKGQLGNGGDNKNPSHAFHSSTASADRHLASLLTSPLLIKRPPIRNMNKVEQDHANAKNDLATSGKDPITILEEYHEKGAATLPIATLCLGTMYKSLEGLHEDAKAESIRVHEPGRRTLLWLFKTNLHLSELFTESKSIMAPLAYFLIREDLEQYLWEWLKLDIGTVEGPLDNESKTVRLRRKYRWKADLLQAMLQVKLDAAFIKDYPANAALDAFLEACDMRQNAPKGDCLRYLPLGGAGHLIVAALTHKYAQSLRVDAERYERLFNSIQIWSTNTVAEFNKASLLLWHPQTPTGLPAYDLLKRLSVPAKELSNGDRIVSEWMHNPKGDSPRSWILTWMTKATSVLQEGGYGKEAEWVEERVLKRWPNSVRSRTAPVDTTKTRTVPRGNDPTEEEDSRRLPFATFAGSLRP